jgi:hypothetical protein
MKKVLLVLVLVMAVLAVNAQATKSTVTNTKETSERNVVMVNDLQKTITDHIAKDYVGYTTKEATKVTSKGIVTYEVVVVKGTTPETLVFDKDGKFVKKLPPATVK